MDIADLFEHRRLRMQELVNARCKGVAAEAARKMKREASYVTRMLSPVGTAGKKNISDVIALLIEQSFDLPRCWLDMPLGVLVDAPNGTAVFDVHGIYRVNTWPFLRVTPGQYNLLQLDERLHLEEGILMQIRGREPPEKQAQPEKTSAAA